MTEELPPLGDDFWAVWEVVERYVNTRDRTNQVRRLRLNEGRTWREIGEYGRNVWDGAWHPICDFYAGIAMCHAAAHMCGEVFSQPPWN